MKKLNSLILVSNHFEKGGGTQLLIFVDIGGWVGVQKGPKYADVILEHPLKLWCVNCSLFYQKALALGFVTNPDKQTNIFVKLSKKVTPKRTTVYCR